MKIGALSRGHYMYIIYARIIEHLSRLNVFIDETLDILSSENSDHLVNEASHASFIALLGRKSAEF